VLGQGYNFSAGQLLLIETTALVPADPPVRELITVASADEQSDPLFPGPPNPATLLTHIVFSTPLASDHDLSYADDLGRPRTLLAGNLVPATQARRFRETFAIDTPPASAFQTPLALVRDGANQATTPEVVEYLYPLSNAPLAWLGDAADDKADPLPEMILTEQPGSTNPILWTWEQKLLDAEKFENAFTVEPARYVEVNRNSDGTRCFDYAGEDGDTIRFGDGVFGSMPQSGSVFEVQYRVGGGTAGNVAADAITRFDPTAGSLILSVTNPFPASGGADAEPIETVRRLAPQAFRAVQFRAVRPEDYQNAAETLPWVERAGTVFRWTGSWLTVFTTADPKGGEDIPVPLRTQLIDLLNRYRLAGYESYVPAPQYVALDLSIEVCARSDAFQEDVETAVLAALSATKPSGLFYPDNFTFGTPLERSALEAAIQNAYGVGGVYSIQYVRRGVTLQPVEMPDTISISNDEILRVDNDPSRPERGSLKIQVKGGK
jgi:Baseplate J-like protein